MKPSSVSDRELKKVKKFRLNVNDLFLYRAAKNNFKAIEKRYNSAQAEFDVGLLSKTDVALAKTRMSAAKILLINSDISFRQAKNLFMDIIGKKAQNLEFESIKSTETYNIDEFIETLLYVQ